MYLSCVIVAINTKQRPSSVHSYTWVPSASTNDNHHRLDYVAIPQELQQHSINNHVRYDFDPLATKEDHYPVIVHMNLASTEHFHHTTHTKQRIDRSRFQDQALVASFKQHLLQLDVCQ